METVQPTVDIVSDHRHNKKQLQHHQYPQQPHQQQQQQQHPHQHPHQQHPQQQHPQQQNSHQQTTRAPQQLKGGAVGGAGGGSSFDSQAQSSMAYQHKHALHRLRRLKKRSPHRDLVISFVPRLRTSIINRLDFFHRYSKQEQEVLSCFDFLDELVLTYCDGGLDSPRYSQKLYQTLIYEFI